MSAPVRQHAGVATVGVFGLVGARGRQSRAKLCERRKRLPGDELVPHPKWQATRAITIHAPREEVWAWLVQMGFPTNRAGWYTPFWLDRLVFGITTHSADVIVPELQNLAVGDRVPDSDSGVSFFTVANLEPPSALVLHSATNPLPAYTDVNFAWAFVLEGAANDTRLIMRARVDYKPVWPSAIVRLLMVVGFGIGDFVQAGGMLNGIKRRAERSPCNHVEAPVRSGQAAVDLYWIPLGAGDHCVRVNGKVFEAIEAAHQHRARNDLYHAALIVHLGGERYTIELAPSPNANEASRGVVATGAVGSHLIGGLRLFRYEARCWPGGSIPDLPYAVGTPRRLTTDPQIARRLLDVTRNVPTPVWGRDELKTGEMWNSNSLISWALATSGLPTDQLHPPRNGRAPGWDSGLTLAKRNTTGRVGVVMSAAQKSPPDMDVVRVAGARPTPRQLARELGDVAVGLPLFATAPLVRRWHRHWGATEDEVTAVMPGDELVPECRHRFTRAITIAATPRNVWPWLVQVGFGKAGFYSNDLLDNVGHPSTDRIVDDFQHPAVGEWVPMFNKINDTTAFRIAAIKPEAELVWAKPDSTWSWKLTEVDGDTRLVTRLRFRYEWHNPAGALLSLILYEFGDFPMMRKMLLTIKQRAEATNAQALTPAEIIRKPVHQQPEDHDA